MSYTEIAVSVGAFATAGFVVARVLSYNMDIDNKGLSGVYVSGLVAVVCAFVGLLIALIGGES